MTNHSLKRICVTASLQNVLAAATSHIALLNSYVAVSIECVAVSQIYIQYMQQTEGKDFRTARSHGNSYIFYEVANSYEFV